MKEYDVFVVIQEDLTHEEALAGKAAEMRWYSVDHLPRDEAIELVQNMSLSHANRTGHGFDELDQ